MRTTICSLILAVVSGVPNIEYPFYDRDVLVTNCGRICMHREKINISSVMAGQRLGIKEVDDGIWLVSFMQYDLGYIDLEQRTLQTIDNPFVVCRHSVQHVGISGIWWDLVHRVL